MVFCQLHKGLTTHAKEGDAHAQLDLGRHYEKGTNGYKANPKLALSWYQKAAQQGLPQAMYRLACLYQKHGGTPAALTPDPEKAWGWKKRAADAGHLQAQVEVGHAYRQGLSYNSGKNNNNTKMTLVTPDLDHAAHYYQLAAGPKGQHSEAQYQLGKLYLKGQGVELDLKLAQKWLQMAVNKGHTEAPEVLQDCQAQLAKAQQALQKVYRQIDACLFGLNVRGGIHPTQAQALVDQHLVPESEDALSVGYRALLMDPLYYPVASGYLGLQQNATQAAALWKHAVALGLKSLAQPTVDSSRTNVHALFFLGQLYVYGKTGLVPTNPKKAAQLFQVAADAGYAPAQHALGVCYKKGLGAPQNLVLASTWFQTAATQGHAGAQYALSQLYKTSPASSGGTVDLKLSHHFLTLAANQGHALALTQLGHHYRLGVAPPNHEQANASYQKAWKERGYIGAQFSMARQYEQGHGMKTKQVKQAVQIYQTLAEQVTTSPNVHTADAAYRYSQYLYDGHKVAGVRKDRAAALVYCQKAAHAGNPQALYAMGNCHSKKKAVRLEWYEKAATAGHAGAMWELYESHRKQKDTQAQARTWLEKAAQQGHAQAKLTVAR